MVDSDCPDGNWGPPADAVRKPASTGVSDPLLSVATSGAGAPKSSAGGSINGKSDKKSIAVTILTILISIPALVGTWCWPVLLAGATGIAATGAAKAAAHAVTFWITLGIMLFVNAFIFYQCWKRRAYYANISRWKRWGPLFFSALAAPLVMADLTRHLIQDSCDPNGCYTDMGVGCMSPGELCWCACRYVAPTYDVSVSPATVSNQLLFDACGSNNTLVANAACPPLSFDNYANSGMYDSDGPGGLSYTGWLFTVFFTYTGFASMMFSTIWAAGLTSKIAKRWRELRGYNSV